MQDLKWQINLFRFDRLDDDSCQFDARVVVNSGDVEWQIVGSVIEPAAPADPPFVTEIVRNDLQLPDEMARRLVLAVMQHLNRPEIWDCDGLTLHIEDLHLWLATYFGAETVEIQDALLAGVQNAPPRRSPHGGQHA